MKHPYFFLAVVTAFVIAALTQPAQAMYHPTVGRFLQRDPIGYVDGMSLYQYVLSNSLRFPDPYGLIFGCSGPGDKPPKKSKKRIIGNVPETVPSVDELPGESPPKPGVKKCACCCVDELVVVAVERLTKNPVNAEAKGNFMGHAVRMKTVFHLGPRLTEGDEIGGCTFEEWERSSHSVDYGFKGHPVKTPRNEWHRITEAPYQTSQTYKTILEGQLAAAEPGTTIEYEVSDTPFATLQSAGYTYLDFWIRITSSQDARCKSECKHDSLTLQWRQVLWAGTGGTPDWGRSGLYVRGEDGSWSQRDAAQADAQP